MKIRKMQNAGVAETPHVNLSHQTTPIDNLHHYLYTPRLGEIKIAPEGSSAAYLKNKMLNVDINEVPFTTLPTEQYSLRDVQKMAKDDFERGIDGGIAKYDVTNPGEINSDKNWDYEYWAHRTGLKDNIKKRYINRLIKLHKKDPISAGSLLAKYQRDGKVPTNYVLPKTSDGETARQNLTSYYSSPQYGLNKAFYDKVNDFALSSVAVAGMGAANHALKLYKPLRSLKTGPKPFVSPFAKPSMASHFGKQLLKGVVDYTLADTAVTGVTGKSIIGNINNTVKLIGGDNKATDVITNYVTPFAPIPIFGTGKFGNSMINLGKKVASVAKQYPELLYNIDKSALNLLNNTGISKWLINKDYKWLDKKVPFYNTIFNHRLPKSVRDRVYKDTHMYNIEQMKRLGDPGYTIPKDEIIYQPPTIRGQIKNSLGETALADALKYKNLKRIRFYLEGLAKDSNSIGTLYHENRHLIQYSPLISNLTVQNRVIPNMSNYASGFNKNFYDDMLLPASKRLYNNSSYNDEWSRKLTEFDAEMANFRGSDLRPYHMMDDLSKDRIKRLASERFGITENDADYIATQLSINGYKSGGKINKAE